MNDEIGIEQLTREVRAMIDFLREKGVISPDIQNFAIKFVDKEEDADFTWEWGDGCYEVQVEIPTDIIAQIRQAQS